MGAACQPTPRLLLKNKTTSCLTECPVRSSQVNFFRLLRLHDTDWPAPLHSIAVFLSVRKSPSLLCDLSLYTYAYTSTQPPLATSSLTLSAFKKTTETRRNTQKHAETQQTQSQKIPMYNAMLSFPMLPSRNPSSPTSKPTDRQILYVHDFFTPSPTPRCGLSTFLSLLSCACVKDMCTLSSFPSFFPISLLLFSARFPYCPKSCPEPLPMCH